MKIGRFDVLEKLGEGGMGVVFRALDPNLDRTVAIKKLTLVTAEYLERFRQEAKAAAKLHHPNITLIYESDTDPTDGHPYIVMEFLDGSDLRTLLREHTLGGVARKLDAVRQAAVGLDYAHAQGVAVHRDVKPANIQVTASGTVKIMDFGIAKLADEIHMTRNLTQANMVLGTLPYLSPEQIRGARLDRRSDIWSIGVVLFELLAGYRPFDRPELPDDEVMKCIVLEEPRPLPALGVTDEDELRRIVERALEKDRDRRYQTAGEMASDLASYLELLAGRATAPRRRPRAARDWFDEGKSHYSSARFKPAVECFRRVLAEIPEHPGALSNIEICERAYAKKHAEDTYKIGLLLFRNREYGVAAAAFEDLLAIQPDHADARTLYAWARREQTKQEERTNLGDVVRDLLQSDPDHPGAEDPARGHALPAAVEWASIDRARDAAAELPPTRSFETPCPIRRPEIPASPPATAPDRPDGDEDAPTRDLAPPPPRHEPEPVELGDRSTSRVSVWLKKIRGK